MSQVSDRLANLETQIVSQDCSNLDTQELVFEYLLSLIRLYSVMKPRWVS